jgi:signal transduction histidine kinase
VAVALGGALRALERAREGQIRAERLATIGQLSAMVAHEVRNPLGILRGQLELTRERTSTQEDRSRLDDMLEEVHRINGVTEEFLSLARDTPLDLSPCDLSGLIEEVSRAARSMPIARDAVIETAVTGGPLNLQADREKLRRVLLNLILNAIQAAGGPVRIRIEARRELSGVKVRVSDDGPGVPRELAQTLFEPFVGARSGGSGLGLAVARQIILRHGGKIGLEESHGSGATFLISLPI